MSDGLNSAMHANNAAVIHDLSSWRGVVKRVLDNDWLAMDGTGGLAVKGSTNNRLAMNGITNYRLAMNGSTENRLAMNGRANNRLVMDGIPDNRLAMD